MKKYITILFLIVSLAVNATNYYVSTTGNDVTGNGTIGTPWASLYKASQMVTTSGDVINITAGSYTESHMCSIAVGVSIVGADQATTIINCTYYFSVLPSGDFTKGCIAFISSTENTNGNQSVTDLTLDGGWVSLSNTNTTTATRGICIVKRGNITLTRITVKNFFVTGIGVYGGYPFSQPTTRTNGNSLTYSTIRNNGNGYWTSSYEGGACVEIYGQSNMLVHHNTMRNTDRYDRNSDLMARFDFCTGLKIYNNEFYKTEEEGPNNLWNFGLETWNIQGGCEIYDNNFYGAYGPIDIGGPVNTKGTYDYSVKIYRNRIVRTTLVDANKATSAAINLEAKADCSDIYIYENYIENFALALYMVDGSATEVNHKARIYYYKNLAVNCGWQQTWTMPIISISLVVHTGSTITDLYIENNTFVGSSGKSQYGIDFFNVGTSNNIFIRNNIFYQLQNANSVGFVNLPDIKDTRTSGSRTNFNIVNNLAYLTGNSNNVSYTGTITSYTNANNIKVDPLFVSTSTLDFHLQTNSPAINAGIDIGLPFLSTAPDLGYAEYVFENPAVLPTVTIEIPTKITSRTVSIDAASVLDGGGTISERGVVWAYSALPTTANNKIVSGSGLGAYLVYITGLNPATAVYVRSYSINQAGTAYSRSILFSTSFSSSMFNYGKAVRYKGKTLKF